MTKSGGKLSTWSMIVLLRRIRYTYKTYAFKRVNGRAEEQGYLRPMGHGRSGVESR